MVSLSFCWQCFGTSMSSCVGLKTARLEKPFNTYVGSWWRQSYRKSYNLQQRRETSSDRFLVLHCWENFVYTECAADMYVIIMTIRHSMRKHLFNPSVHSLFFFALCRARTLWEFQANNLCCRETVETTTAELVRVGRRPPSPIFGTTHSHTRRHQKGEKIPDKDGARNCWA